MPRAQRRFDHHSLWHITHRCHNRDFLLRFAQDRDTWRHWLWRARRRFGLTVLNYIVTRNHIHLMVESHDRTTIPAALKLAAGCTAQKYNERKDRRGAFWEDRYHAVAIETPEHFARCVVYVDLNMVRAGAVREPLEWRWSGWFEMHRPRQRYVLIDGDRLQQLLGHTSIDEHVAARRHWLHEAMAAGALSREPRWTEPQLAYDETSSQALVSRLGPAASP